MPAEYDPAREIFNPDDSPSAMLEAVQQLAEAAGESLESMRGRTFAEIGAQADQIYDEASMPSFWRVWKDWHTPRPSAEMGDL